MYVLHPVLLFFCSLIFFFLVFFFSPAFLSDAVSFSFLSLFLSLSSNNVCKKCVLISVEVSNRMVSFHTMVFSLFATAGDDKMAKSISFVAAGVSLRRIHAIISLTVSLGALVCAGGVSMNVTPTPPVVQT